jgi:putative PIN family toxin of toxin-antitoxin system
MRAVVDTNVLVRAVIRPRGSCRLVLLGLRHGDYTLLYSQALLDELVDVLNRPRIRQKYGLTEQDIAIVLRLLLMRGEAISATTRIIACRDPKDDKFLEVALSGRADVIVSGDQDMLVLHPFEGIPIVPIGTFVEMLRAGD